MVVLTSARAHEQPRPRPAGSVQDGPAVDETDRTLIRACRAGDAQAWDDLIKRYERLVFSVALRNGLEREDAADVTQEVFIALLDALDSLKDEAALASWLMTVARRTAWRTVQRNGRRRRAPVESQRVLVDDPTEEWTRVAVLHDAVAQLAEPCRTLIHQLYLDSEPASYAELADRMGRSIGGIGPLRGRCLQHLRILIGDDF